MSENQETRTDHIARYKEERRKQLAAQYSNNGPHQLQGSLKKFTKDANSSGADGPRATRASRLRAAATAAAAGTAQDVQLKEKSPASTVISSQASPVRLERDKSSKRKSNLNRSLTSEEVPSVEYTDGVKSRRRRRRFFPPDVFNQSQYFSSNEDKVKSDTSLTAHNVSPLSSPITASTTRCSPRKSELSIHMENARKGMTPACSEIGRNTRRVVTCSLRDKLPKLLPTDVEYNYNIDAQVNRNSNFSNKENVKRPTNIFSSNKSMSSTKKVPVVHNDDRTDKYRKNIGISKRMDELTALTHETLARVESLASKNRVTHKNGQDYKFPTSTKSNLNADTSQSKDLRPLVMVNESFKPHTSSILKKKSPDEYICEQVNINTGHPAPVSILKRKVSQEECKGGSLPLTHTPPVTFSPNVVEPTSSSKKQGILKKRRSLDESQVLRHRSCSPDVANSKSDSRSILKNQRRSSLEEITRTRSPDAHLQGILKRKPFRSEDDPENPLNSPQGILKRRSGASSAGSTSGTQHVSIATAVILAAAGGAEIILDTNDHVKPILKKKSSEEHSHTDNSYNEGLKPILKKKSSTDTDDSEDKPKKPILKTSRNSLDNRELSESDTACYRHSFPTTSDSGSECDVRPILKQTSSVEDSQRVKLSFSHQDDVSHGVPLHAAMRRPRNRRADTVCTDFNVINPNGGLNQEFDCELRRPRPLSLSELVMNFEKTSTGAIPKKISIKRSSDRYRTQPVTFDEIEASLNFVQIPQLDDFTKATASVSGRLIDGGNNVQSLVDLSSSLENESILNNLLSSTINTISAGSGVGKMSSDSAFQSLGDGLELEDDKCSPVSCQPLSEKLESSELQMKAIAEEAKTLRLRKNKDESSPSNLSLSEKIKMFNASLTENNLLKREVPKRRRAQFQTQPITPTEVESARAAKNFFTLPSASDKDESSPGHLSLSEKIKMFNASLTENNSLKREVPKRRRAQIQTQPITPTEVESARAAKNFSTLPSASENGPSTTLLTERKGILKSKLGYSRLFKSTSPPPRSVLKKAEAGKLTDDILNPKSILKPETVDFTYDEGISSDESSSDSDAGHISKFITVSNKESAVEKYTCNKSGISARLATINVDKLPEVSSKSCSDAHTSEDSSGGREIQSIIGREAAASALAINKNFNERLIKSKSEAEISDGPQNGAEGTQRSMTQVAMHRTIGQLQAKLQQSGDSDWRKRIAKLNNSGEELSILKAKNLYNEELSEKSSVLAAKIDELDAASQQWRNRVEKTDATNFSVAGRMQDEEKSTTCVNIPLADKHKRPKAKRFKLKEDDKDSVQTPISSDSTGNFGFKRSISVPGSETYSDLSGSEHFLRASGCRVKVLKPDDETFTSFFKSTDEIKSEEKLELSVDDFDIVTRQTEKLLVQKRTIKAQKRRNPSKNPVKALASRSDIVVEYEEFLTGIADREIKRLNVEKLAKSSSFALEALAGLASKEDFSSVLLKKCSSPKSSLLPYKDLMLIHIKGRRHVQTRLVEPKASSINEGDDYVLITRLALYNYIGKYSNIIEQSRACDVINYIQQTGDMGCKADKVITIDSRKSTSQIDVNKFWKLLGSSSDICVTEAGHPDEDEIYESSILRTNMIYGIDNSELVPIEEYWGRIPKIDMLKPSKVLVFDFGTEMYVWSGTTAAPDEKKLALKLANEFWSEGYNYSECEINPINIAQMLGSRKNLTDVVKSGVRPNWGLFAKITQHRETVLFREKFLDWPDYSRVIKIKIEDNDKSDSSATINPCDVTEMRHSEYSEPDFQIEGTHLGRGHSYFDSESNRQYEISTLCITAWRILENTFEELSGGSLGHYYEADTYIIRWQYRVTVTGRKLTGKPSSHNQTGRDRCVYFCWLGNNATINEKGAAALLTVELDSEHARQVRITQGLEPTAFVRLFDGKMVVHGGKCDSSPIKSCKLYIVRGEVEEETVLIEVQCSTRSLRSRACFILVNTEMKTVTVWNGHKCSDQTRKVTKELACYVQETKSSHFGLDIVSDVKVEVIDEGEENDEFLEVLGGRKQLYMSLTNSLHCYDYTPRLFHLSSVLGSFRATEVFCLHRSGYVTSYPFLQSELYSANQPALFLLDNNHEIWLWQGWWPEKEDDSDLFEQVGSGALRWQAERKAAMQTAIDYWKYVNKESKSIPAYLVWAGLEPLEFTTLFPIWADRDDIAEINIKDGRKAGEAILVENELAQLTRTTYPLSQLLQRPLPEGVDPTHLEVYLSPDEFSQLLCMTKSEFQKLPAWKQTAIKKEKGLF